MDAEQVSRVYEEVSGLSAPLSARVSEEQLPEARVYTVTAEWSQSDLVRGARLRYTQQWTLIADNNDHKNIRTVLPPGSCAPVSGELLSGLSPICGLRAVVRENSDQQLLEIWDCNGLRRCLNLTAVNKHGRVYDDAQFGCLSWSDCENKLLYVAEKSKNISTERQEGESACRKDRSVYCEDWGEGLTNKSSPVLCVVNLQKGTVSVLQGVAPHIPHLDRLCGLLGVSQCFLLVGTTNPSDLDGSSVATAGQPYLNWTWMGIVCLSGDNLSVECPRLSPDQSTLIYLQGQVFGPHNQCLSLQQLDLNSGKTSILLDVVNRPQTGEFAGVYEPLPCYCWSADSQRVVFSSACRNYKDLFLLDRRSKKVTFLSEGPAGLSRVYGSWKLLTVQRDLMVVCCSSPSTPPTLRVGFIPSAGEKVSWQTLKLPVKTFDFHWTIIDVMPPPEEENPSCSGVDFGAVLVKPSHFSHEATLPLAVFIHGGPNSQFPAEWNCTTAGLAQLGFALLMVNYRGSTGFGQDSILSLIGHIGNQDVKDVQRAVLTVLQTDLALDPKRLVVIGGSHGGFLSCHLVGQYPDFYRACAARNPVINAATLLGTSDIIDWRYTSVGLQYSYDRIPTAEALAVMLEKSPITYAAQIKAPVLLMLGGRDRRVSPQQGLELYKALKSRSSPVRLLWFAEDGHSLSGVVTQADCFLNIVLWFYQHL